MLLCCCVGHWSGLSWQPITDSSVNNSADSSVVLSSWERQNYNTILLPESYSELSPAKYKMLNLQCAFLQGVLSCLNVSVGFCFLCMLGSLNKGFHFWFFLNIHMYCCTSWWCKIHVGIQGYLDMVPSLMDASFTQSRIAYYNHRIIQQALQLCNGALSEKTALTLLPMEWE